MQLFYLSEDEIKCRISLQVNRHVHASGLGPTLFVCERDKHTSSWLS